MLIKCPDCGRKVSDQAIRCPKCDRQILGNLDEGYIKQQEEKNERRCQSVASLKFILKYLGLKIALTGVVGIALLWFGIKFKSDYEGDDLSITICSLLILASILWVGFFLCNKIQKQ